MNHEVSAELSKYRSHSWLKKYNVSGLYRRAMYKLCHCTIIVRIDSEEVRRPRKEIQQDFSRSRTRCQLFGSDLR